MRSEFSTFGHLIAGLLSIERESAKRQAIYLLFSFGLLSDTFLYAAEVPKVETALTARACDPALPCRRPGVAMHAGHAGYT